MDTGNGTPSVLDFIGCWNEEELLANGLCSQMSDGEERKEAAIYQFGGERQDAPRMIERCFVLSLIHIFSARAAASFSKNSQLAERISFALR